MIISSSKEKDGTFTLEADGWIVARGFKKLADAGKWADQNGYATDEPDDPEWSATEIPGSALLRHQPTNEPELLIGHKQIARFLNLSPRQVSWQDEQGTLPTFKIGRSVCARKSKLVEWVENLEAQSYAVRREKKRGR